MRPHNLPLVMLGAGLLWFGWFGFNAGSALGANGQAGRGLGHHAWSPPVPRRSAGCSSSRSVTVTPPRSAPPPASSPAWSRSPRPARRSTPLGAIAVGALAGVLCALAVGLKYRFGFDDSLDVVGVHLVGGLWGTIAVGFFASAAATAGVDGLFYGGGVDQLVAADRGRARRARLLLRADPGHRLRDREDHRLPDRRGGRGRGHRLHRAR